MTAGLEVPALLEAGLAGSDARLDALPAESWGWSSQPEVCAPKIAALASLVNLAPPAPVARVTYQSRGNALVIAGRDVARAIRAAQALCARLNVTLLSSQPEDVANVTAWGGEVRTLSGWLGQFTATIANLRIAGGEA